MLDRRFDQIARFAVRRPGRNRRCSNSDSRGTAQVWRSARRFEQMFAPEQWPDGAFELILLSEVVYYLSPEDVGRLAARVAGSLPRGGSVILVHWTGPTDYPLRGDEAATLFIERIQPTWVLKRGDRYRQFRLDVLSRA
jgi:hypothetical protein